MFSTNFINGLIEAFLSKDIYDKKREWAAKRMEQNTEKGSEKGLTEEQAEVLADLCTFRHEFHTHMNSLVMDNTSSFQELIRLNIRLVDSGLPSIPGVPKDTTDYIDIDDMNVVYELEKPPEDRDDRRKWIKDNTERILKELGKLHSDIESYLATIDEKYETSYCPSGATRIY